MRRALLAALLLFPSVVSGHGGLPISETIIFRGDTLVVPTKFWGVFYGADGTIAGGTGAGGPWRWICEEAINRDQDRRWSLAGDGTYHVTDFVGVTSSRDGGCTWTAATGEIATRSASSVVADPVDVKRAWVTTDGGPMSPWNALFRSDDDGLTWSATLTGDEYLRGVALSADGKRLYVTGTPRGAAGDGGVISPVLHVSHDGGGTWSAAPLDYTFNGISPYVVAPLAVDPSDPDVVYLVAAFEPTAVLLRARADGTATELLRADGTVKQPGVAGIDFIAEKREIFVATKQGLYRSVAGAAFAKLPGLSQAQCVVRHGKALYACSWNYCPDAAAIVRSDDDGAHFTRVFQYADTVGPTDACGAATQVGMTCPGVWQMYADQLGITIGVPSAPLVCADGGSAGGGGAGGGCSCGVGAGRGAAGLSLVLVALLGARLLRRSPGRRRRAHRRSC